MEGHVPTDAELWEQSRRLRRLVRVLVGSEHSGEDIAQDAWVVALRKPGLRAADLSAWLGGVVRHLALRARRRESRRAEVERRAARPEAVDGPAEAVARAELQQRLGEAVLALDEPYRSAVILRHLDQLDPGEIGRRQGCTREAARQRVARGLEQLRGRLDAEHGGRERWCLLFAPPGHGRTLAPVVPLGGIVMGSKLVLVSAAALTAALLLWLTRAPERSEPSGPRPSAVHDASSTAAAQTTREARAPAPEERVAITANARTAPAGPASTTDDDFLRGRVIDRSGAAVPDARVSLRRGELPGFSLLDLEVAHTAELLAEVRSDSDGRFAFPLARGKAVDVWAEKDGFCEGVALDRHAGQTLVLVLGPGFRVHGRVTRELDRRPVADARVVAGQLGGRAWAHRIETRTDANGTYELRLPVGERVQLDVLPLVEQARDNLPVEFGPDGEAELDVQVVAGLTVTGRVTAAGTGRPIAGALIGEGWTYQRTAVSDVNGEYRLDGFGVLGINELYARASGFGQAVDSPTIVDARNQRLDFELQPARTAGGRLVDEGGRAIADAYVAAVAKGRSSAMDWSSARTDADGRFLCVDLVPELRHTLIASHPSFATLVRDFPADEQQRSAIDLGAIELLPPGLVAGRVLDAAGRGLADAKVTLRGDDRDRRRLAPGQEAEKIAEPYASGRETSTDEEGRFWFGNVAAGDYALAARREGRAPRPDMLVSLATGQQRDDIALVFPLGATLRGRVVDENGAGLGGVLLYAERESEERAAKTKTRSAEDGSFEWLDVPPGEYTLEVLPFLPGTMPSSDPEAPWLYTVLEHVAADSAPALVTVRRGDCIQGVLRNAAGEPLYGHSISIRDEHSGHGLGGTTDSEGRFVLGVEPGTLWTLEVSGPGGTLTRANVTAGTRGLELILQR
jgi:RNA polymerase sigma factor (sigma-70 family)